MMPGDAFPKEVVYAVVRLDLFLEGNAPVAEIMTIKEVLPTETEANDEIIRLNAGVDTNRVQYVVQPTRYYPNGRSPSGPISRGDDNDHDSQ
jgi:hypothetical protein